MGRSSEFERIARLQEVFASDRRVEVGIGDDAAVLVAPASPLVWTVDAQVEGTHFERAWMGWRDVGWRSFMAAASDLAAMGAVPIGALSSLVLADDVDDDALAALTEGQAAAARSIGAAVVGGNLARGRETSITTTLLGACERAVLRRGARPGERLWIAGAIGLARAGLLTLVEGRATNDPRLAPALAAFRRPEARIADGLAMRAAASAAIDVSDGLASDVRHLAEASEVRVVLDAERVRAHGGSALRDAADALGHDALDLATTGGEDYAVLATASEPLPGFSCIGHVEAGAGVFLTTPDGVAALAPSGFDHFAR